MDNNITTRPGPNKTVTIVYRDLLPVGHATYIPQSKKFAMKVYCVPAPFDWFGGAADTLDAAVDFIAREGETPEYKRADTRYHAK